MLGPKVPNTPRWTNWHWLLVRLLLTVHRGAWKFRGDNHALFFTFSLSQSLSILDWGHDIHDIHGWGVDVLFVGIPLVPLEASGLYHTVDLSVFGFVFCLVGDVLRKLYTMGKYNHVSRICLLKVIFVYGSLKTDLLPQNESSSKHQCFSCENVFVPIM